MPLQVASNSPRKAWLAGRGIFSGDNTKAAVAAGAWEEEEEEEDHRQDRGRHKGRDCETVAVSSATPELCRPNRKVRPSDMSA